MHSQHRNIQADVVSRGLTPSLFEIVLIVSTILKVIQKHQPQTSHSLIMLHLHVTSLVTQGLLTRHMQCTTNGWQHMAILANNMPYSWTMLISYSSWWITWHFVCLLINIQLLKWYHTTISGWFVLLQQEEWLSWQNKYIYSKKKYNYRSDYEVTLFKACFTLACHAMFHFIDFMHFQTYNWQTDLFSTMACFHVISISLISGGDHPCAH